MIVISHRGNLDGADVATENSPIQVDAAIGMGYQVEIDFWVINKGQLYLGHDLPQYLIDLNWLSRRSEYVWIHCKNVLALEFMYNTKFNYFWHDVDLATITSKGYVWVYPGKQPIKNSIAVMPELYGDDVSGCVGVCTDFPQKYSKKMG